VKAFLECAAHQGQFTLGPSGLSLDLEICARQFRVRFSFPTGAGERRRRGEAGGAVPQQHARGNRQQQRRRPRQRHLWLRGPPASSVGVHYWVKGAARAHTATINKSARPTGRRILSPRAHCGLSQLNNASWCKTMLLLSARPRSPTYCNGRGSECCRRHPTSLHI
jgi:hypothetical protein